MRGGTTQPILSEDLWARVASSRTSWLAVLRNRRKLASDCGLRTEQTYATGRAWLGQPLPFCGLRKAPSQLDGARCLKPYPGKPDVRNFRGAAGNVVYGGTVNPPAIERAGSEKPLPKDARASCLPDHHFHREPCACIREDVREASVAARVAGTIEQRKGVHPECRGSQLDRRQHLQDRDGEGLPGSALSKESRDARTPHAGTREGFNLPRQSCRGRGRKEIV